jgi:hypothetical protein
MSTTTGRGTAAWVAVALLLGASACGGGGAAKDDGGAGTGGAGDAGTAGMDGGDGDVDAADAGGEVLDVATDFGGPDEGEVAIHCPTAGGMTFAAAGAAVLIDDFSGAGKLDGRSREDSGFSVKEQFDATDGALFAPEPYVEATCGAAALGAAHVRGIAADTGATFTMIFSTPAGDGGKPANRVDASGKKGITMRVALGDAQAAKLITVQVNGADSQWDYTKDIIVNGTAWQDVTILWTDLQAAPAAPAFPPAALNQIVFPFSPNADVDLYIDDVAFIP